MTKALIRSRFGNFTASGIVGAALIFSSLPAEMRAENLTTISGTTYCDVHPVRVDPDGIIWQHAGGQCKVDFADSPARIRQLYHYDPIKAAAFHDAEESSRRQGDEQGQALVKAHEDRKVAQFQAVAAAAAVAPNSPEMELILRRGASPAASAATRDLADQVAARNAKLAEAQADNSTILGTPKVWRAIPKVGNYHPTRFFDVANDAEYQTVLHHAAGGFATDSTRDAFYTPSYMTKSYYENLDRAEAFARDLPVKP